MSQIRVAVIGASGEAGRSIVSGLLEQHTTFDISVFVRPGTEDKPIYATFKDQGISIVSYIPGDIEQLVPKLEDIDVLISAVTATAYDEQIPFIVAAKKAGVKRFLPSAYSTVQPPEGVSALRDHRQCILNEVLRNYLPYTYVEFGWWYQSIVPEIPSGRTSYLKLDFPVKENAIPGDGSARLAITDIWDVGRYIARIIADPRTLNKSVVAYAEVHTVNGLYDIWDDVTKEKGTRNYLTGEEIEEMISKGKAGVESGNPDLQAFANLHVGQYWRSWGIREDNTPENARYLGYLDVQELYPDHKPVAYAEWVERAVAGEVKSPLA